MSKVERIIREQENIYEDLCALSDAFDKNHDIKRDDILYFARKRIELMQHYRSNQALLLANKEKLWTFDYFKSNYHKRIELESNFLKQKIRSKPQLFSTVFSNEDDFNSEQELSSESNISKESQKIDSDHLGGGGGGEEFDSTSIGSHSINSFPPATQEVMTSTNDLAAASKFETTVLLFTSQINTIEHFLADGLTLKAKIAEEFLKELYQTSQIDMQCVYDNNCAEIDRFETIFNEMEEKYHILLERIDQEYAQGTDASGIETGMKYVISNEAMTIETAIFRIMRHFLYWWFVIFILSVFNIEPNYYLLFILHLCSLFIT